jgi:hypothetical protein
MDLLGLAGSMMSALLFVGGDNHNVEAMAISDGALTIICADITRSDAYTADVREKLDVMLSDGAISHLEAYVLGYSIDPSVGMSLEVAKNIHPKIIQEMLNNDTKELL